MTLAPPTPGTDGGDPPATAPGPSASARRPAGPVRRRGATHRVRYLVVGAVLLGAFAFLLVKGIGTALNFYLPANQAVAQRASLGGRTFNLEGVVKPGSVHHTDSGVDFVVTSGSTSVAVHNSGTPPQLFQTDIPVIAVGHFQGSAFVSDQILVKHSSDYIAAHPNRVTAPNGSRR